MSHEFPFLSWYALHGGTMPSEGIKGHEWGTYVVLERFSVTEHGIA